jgi:CubicO group peptidase (beta-lactamase class C family)
VIVWSVVWSVSVPVGAAGRTPVAALTRSDLEQWLDTRVPAVLVDGDIAGAVVAVVNGDSVVLAKSYGVADVATKRAWSPAETVLRPGSISKLVTWTAVMQLVERGVLDLDRDVNAWLDFKIPETFARPITLRHLMTHTAGFEERFGQRATYDPSRLVPLATYVKNNLPARIFPPGDVMSYSSYGAALAGYVIERVSHRPFADHVREQIFAPLGMSRSTFVQPLPAELRGDMATAYVVASQRPQPYELTNAAPAGGLATTAGDMSRLMLAFLQEGQLEGHRILDASSVRRMYQPQRSAVPGIGGTASGFFVRACGTRPVVGHFGSTLFWGSDFELIPEAGIGVFVSINSAGRLGSGASMLPRLTHELFDRYVGCGAASGQTASATGRTAPTSGDDARVNGQYRATRRPETSFLRILNLLTAATVTSQSDGTIEVDAIRGRGFEPVRWREAGPLVYHEEGGFRRLAFATDGSGGVWGFAVEGDPTSVYERVTGAHRWEWPLFGLALLVLLVAAIAWPVGFAIRRTRSIRSAGVAEGPVGPDHGAPGRRRPWERWTRALSRAGCVLWLVASAAWGQLILSVANNIVLLSEPLAPRLFVQYGLTWLAVLACVPAVLSVLLARRHSTHRLVALFGEGLIAAAMLYAAWFAFAFNLAGFRATY